MSQMKEVIYNHIYDERRREDPTIHPTFTQIQGIYEESHRTDNDNSTEMSEESRPEVFISYNWDIQDSIKVLYERLTERGFKCWMDIHQMGGGDSFYQRIDKGMRGCKVAISCVTKKYAESDNCCKEINLAEALKRPIIPLLLDDMTWPPEGSLGMLFAQLLYIKCYDDEDLQRTWTGRTFDRLVQQLKYYVPDISDSKDKKVREEGNVQKPNRERKNSGNSETEGTGTKTMKQENVKNVKSSSEKSRDVKKSPDSKTNSSKRQNSESDANIRLSFTDDDKLPPLILVMPDGSEDDKPTDLGNKSVTKQVLAEKKCKLITAAIDLGTTYSGYAYAFKCDLEKKVPTIITNEWVGGRTISHKAPTAVLFNPDKTMNSFGYKAEEKYAELCANDQHWDYYFFHRFKMMLDSSETFSRTTTVTEEGGKSLPALDVFSAAIYFMKEHLLEAVRKRVHTITLNDVHLLLTVPAIWKDAAKLFMREAAEKAGISADQLSIALEPESASVYCQKIPTEKMVDPDGVKLQIAEPHSKFVVADMGGGTVDITVHERQPDGTLKELCKASGGAWGGTRVDKEFISLLKNMFGEINLSNEIFRLFQKDNVEDYIDMLRDFEVKKRATILKDEDKITISLPASLIEIFEEKAKKKLKDVVGKTHFGSNISLVAGNRLRLHAPVVKSLFTPAGDSIVKHLKELFKLPGVSDIDTILMVGGFSGSCLIQEVVRKNFPSKKVYIPGEPDMAVLMGAVLFGGDPDVISYRMTKYTYGTDNYVKFKPGEHPEDKKRVCDGVTYCKDCFFKLVGVDHMLKVGEPTVSKTYNPVRKDQKNMLLKIYASTEKSPKYVTDTSCQNLGSINIDMPDVEGGLNRKVEVKVNFSGTELEVEALEKTTMKTYKSKVDFLG